MRIILSLQLISLLIAQAPPGYYNGTEGLEGQALRLALHQIIDNHQSQSYTSLWTHFQSTDMKPNGMVWDMYSDIPGGTPPYEYTFVSDQCGNYNSENDCYNREHSWPKSWFNNGSPMYTDLFHLYPTDGYVNGRRGNYPYGEVNNPTWISMNGSKVGSNTTSGYSGTVFEPIDEYKGDFARTYFYMSTRYYTEDSGWDTNDMVEGADLKNWAKMMLINWHHDDPVSEKEIERNNAVYTIQQNRNPYIDHPEWADCIWDDNCNLSIEGDTTPLRFTLLQNYPNPFNPVTTIRFSIEMRLIASLRIYDISGHLIETLIDEEVMSGTHTVKWDAANMPSGVYFCRLTHEDYTSVQKLILLK